VLLTQQISFKTGTVITLAVPDEQPGFIYYTESLPSLIESDKEWVTKMRRIVTSLNSAIQNGTAERLIKTRLVDMLLRDIMPDDGSVLKEPFTKLKDTLVPHLKSRLMAAARTKEIDIERLRGRRLVFGLRTIGKDFRLGCYWIWTSHTGAIELPSEDDTLRVLDIADGVYSKGHTQEHEELPSIREIGALEDSDKVASTVVDALCKSPAKTLVTLLAQGLDKRTTATAAADSHEEENDQIWQLEQLQLASYLMELGAYPPALTMLSPLLQRERLLPEIPLHILILIARLYPEPDVDNIWDLILRWRSGQPSNSRILPFFAKVRKKIEMKCLTATTSLK
jgi:hypothetical protein